jgi:hypothetical protein
VTFRLDLRLAGLAAAAGAGYTRYADDLVFSGGPDFARQVERFHVQVCAIALEEGFTVHTRKTRIMRQSVAQQVGGLVLNHHPNVARKEYDVLKAIVHNCTKHGPASQNRAQLKDFRAHLEGRVAYLAQFSPQRGERLRMQLEKIGW